MLADIIVYGVSAGLICLGLTIIIGELVDMACAAIDREPWS